MMKTQIMSSTGTTILYICSPLETDYQYSGYSKPLLTKNEIPLFRTEAIYCHNSGNFGPVTKSELSFLERTFALNEKTVDLNLIDSIWLSADKYRAEPDFGMKQFKAAIPYVQRFMDLYSTQLLPTPSIVVSEDGEIILEWIHSSRKVAVASFDETGLMGYCLRNGKFFDAGAEEVDFTASTVRLPSDFLEKIRTGYFNN